MAIKRIVAFCRLRLLLTVAGGTLALMLPAAKAAAVAPGPGTQITAVSNPVQGTPYEVQQNQDSSLAYTLNYSVGPNSEGVIPAVSSVVVTFSVNNGGTIAESGKSTWTETLTKNLSSPMSVSCEASGPTNGFYSVTCKATLNLLDGTSVSSNTASDIFLVAQLDVNISGPPYVIIDNSNPWDDSPVLETYTASVQGGADMAYATYSWTLSSNIINESGDLTPSNGVDVEGANPEGPGDITCNFTDGAGDQQTSVKSVTVQDEYVVLTSAYESQQDGTPQWLGGEFTVNPPRGHIIDYTGKLVLGFGHGGPNNRG